MFSSHTKEGKVELLGFIFSSQSQCCPWRMVVACSAVIAEKPATSADIYHYGEAKNRHVNPR